MAIQPVANQSQELFEDARYTYISTAASSTDTTLTVQSINKFAIDQVLFIGELGEEKSEIIKTHGATAPTGTTITLLSGLTYDHPVDTKVSIIDYDQVEFSHADTATGAKSVLSTNSIEADALVTIHKDTTKTAGFYFTRFKNSIDTTYSGYSDAIPYGGLADNTVGKIIERALDLASEKISDNLTHNWLQERLWEARRELHNKRKRWSWRQSFNTDLGNVVAGDYRVAMPTDMHKDDTNENVMGLRIGTGDNLTYITKREMDTEWQGTARTTLASGYTVGDGTITLTDSRDFPESGTLQFGDDDTVGYSANAESTGILTVSTAGSSNHSTDDNVYENATFSLPTKYTIWDGYIYFNCVIDNDYADENYWIDYYKTLTTYDSDADVLDEPEYDMYVNYLVWCIKKKQDSELIATNDTDYQLWITGIADLIKKETLGQEILLVPDVPDI